MQAEKDASHSRWFCCKMGSEYKSSPHQGCKWHARESLAELGQVQICRAEVVTCVR
jgi:hypothetical protein